MRRHLRWERALGVGGLVLSSACATIGNSSKQQVGIASVPAQAHVIVDGQDVGTTPLALELSRTSAHTIRIERAGYQPYQTTIGRRLSVWGVAVDVLVSIQPAYAFKLDTFYPLLPLTLFGFDSYAGGLFELRNDHVTATLQPSPQPPE